MRLPPSLPSSAERELTPLLEQAQAKEEYRRVLCMGGPTPREIL